MQYYEWHRINCTYHDDNRRRQEIACPSSLTCVVFDKYKPWKPHIYRGCRLYYRKYSRHYILTQNPGLFDVDFTDIETWLRNSWNTLAIITSDILNNVTVANNYTQTVIDVSDQLPEDVIDTLLDERCYTIFNGLTVMLALHRHGVFRCRQIYDILKLFVATYGAQPFQIVPEDWHVLYYDRNIPNIADHPWYYVNMGRPWADVKIMQLFRCDSDPFPQLVMGTTVIYTSAHSAMFPYFNQSFWNSHSEWLTFEEAVSVTPDYEGFFMAVTRTKRAFKWYLNNHENVATKFNQVTVPSFYYRFYQDIFTIYNSGFRQSRIRKVWNLYIEQTNAQRLLSFILRRQHRFSIPVGFLKDIVSYNVNIFEDGIIHYLRAGGGNVATFYNHYILKRMMSRFLVINRLQTDTSEIKTVMNKFMQDNKRYLWI